MARLPGFVVPALLFGFVAQAATADARPTTAHSDVKQSPVPKERPIQWKLWIGKKTYGLSPHGGVAPLPKGSSWQCKYSEAARQANKKNLGEEAVTLSCWVGAAQVSLTTTCAYPLDPTKHVEEGVMPSEFQHVVLGAKTFVGLSCDVPGYELRTYRKK